MIGTHAYFRIVLTFREEVGKGLIRQGNRKMLNCICKILFFKEKKKTKPKKKVYALY